MRTRTPARRRNMKKAIKEKKRNEQGGRSTKGKRLPEDAKLFDTHRAKPRREGGEYVDGNYAVMLPVEHMEEHGNIRARSEPFEELKALFDGYKQIQKLRMKVNNQILAQERGTDRLDEIDKQYLNKVLADIDEHEEQKGKLIKAWVKANKTMPIIKAMLSVKGVGEISVAACLTFLDVHKADHPSSFWAYAGYHRAAHERYVKNSVTDKPGNRTLRCALYVLAGCFIKNPGCAYREVYDLRKKKTEQSEKITLTRLTGKTGVYQVAWKDVKPSHRHGDAIRVMMKAFLADLWFVWRTIEGLPVNDLYVKEHLGHESGMLDPKARGWEY